MELIRQYYAALAPLAPPYFGTGGSPTGNHGVRYGRWSFLFTMASMVIVVNCVLGGATIGLLCDLAFKVPLPGAAGLGVAAGLAQLALSLRYEHRRLTPVVLSSYVAAAPESPDGRLSAPSTWLQRSCHIRINIPRNILLQMRRTTARCTPASSIPSPTRKAGSSTCQPTHRHSRPNRVWPGKGTPVNAGPGRGRDTQAVRNRGFF